MAEASKGLLELTTISLWWIWPSNQHDLTPSPRPQRSPVFIVLKCGRKNLADVSIVALTPLTPFEARAFHQCFRGQARHHHSSRYILRQRSPFLWSRTLKLRASNAVAVNQINTESAAATALQCLHSFNLDQGQFNNPPRADSDSMQRYRTFLIKHYIEWQVGKTLYFKRHFGR